MKRSGNLDYMSLFSLKYKNPKSEDEYSKNRKTDQKRLNLHFTMWCLVFSTLILVWIIWLTHSVDSDLISDKIKIIIVDPEDVPRLSNITTVFYKKYALVNETNINSRDAPSYLETKGEYAYLLRKYVFIKKCLPLSIIITVCYFTILIICLIFNGENLQTNLFGMIYFLFAFNFHILSGTLRSFFNFSSDSILFIVTTQLFIRILIILIAKVKWTSILIVCFANLIIEWGLIPIFHYQVPETLIFYLGVNDLIHLLCVILAYYSEFNSKINFFLLRRLKFEREYLINFLYNMKEGFFTYSNNKILFMNRAMHGLVNSYEKLQNISINDTILANNLNQNNSSSSKSADEDEIFFNSDNFDLKIKPESKFYIEKIIQSVTEYNRDLPVEILYLFNNIATNNNKFDNGGFTIENLFRMVKEYGVMNFNNFVILGNINFFDETFGASFKYQISFRIIDHEEDRGRYLEMMFTDISKITQIEREKTIDDCRSMYLSKVAHEFKNPLSSLLELTENIKEATEKADAKREICSYADHTKVICKIMELYLKDFTVFANMQNRCSILEICDNLNYLTCQICKKENLCSKCKSCSLCDEIKLTNFEYSELITQFIDLFKSLSRHESKNMQIKFIPTLKQNSSHALGAFSDAIIPTEYKFLKTDKEMFHSIIFNIIYYAYKYTRDGEITITSEILNNNHVLFEITDTGLEIDQIFIQNLENKKIIFEEKNENFVHNDYISFSHFNKYLGLYIAYSLVKKIGSRLKIESSLKGNKYSFIVGGASVKRKSFNPEKRIFNPGLRASTECCNVNSKMNPTLDVFFTTSPKWKRKNTLVSDKKQNSFDYNSKIIIFKFYVLFLPHFFRYNRIFSNCRFSKGLPNQENHLSIRKLQTSKLLLPLELRIQ
jgi:signal transduction histidine kinase